MHLGRQTIPARVIRVDSMLSAEHDENEVRKGFNVQERVAIGLALEAELGERRGRPAEEIVQNFGHLQGRKTDAIAAERAGFGNPESYRQAKKVVQQGVPELAEAVDRGDIAVSMATAAHRGVQALGTPQGIGATAAPSSC